MGVASRFGQAKQEDREREREREREMFLSWGRPTREQQKACVASAGAFNYDPTFHGFSSAPNQDTHAHASLSHHGFFVNRARVLLGSGPATFRRAKSALLSWRHFGLGWAFVDPATPVEPGTRFCACVKELLPWLMMPLQIQYVKDFSGASTGVKASFGFGSGTLKGHLLAGEERFSVEWDENDQVWYEIFSFSKPAHFLTMVGYPYVQLRQKFFAQQSTNAVLKHVTAQQSAR